MPYNIGEFSVKDCIEIGIARVSLPSILIMGAIRSMKTILEGIKEESSFEKVKNEIIDFDFLNKIIK